MNALFYTDFTFSLLLEEHNILFILGMLVLFLSIVLHAVKSFSVQAVLLFLLYAIEEKIAIWILWSVKEAVDISYYRHSEKTLKRARYITKGGNTGTHPFLF